MDSSTRRIEGEGGWEKKKETREEAREERGSALEGAGGAAARLEALTPLA